MCHRSRPCANRHSRGRSRLGSHQVGHRLRLGEERVVAGLQLHNGPGPLGELPSGVDRCTPVQGEHWLRRGHLLPSPGLHRLLGDRQALADRANGDLKARLMSAGKSARAKAPNREEVS